MSSIIRFSGIAAMAVSCFVGMFGSISASRAALPILDEFNDQTNDFPTGWIADPANGDGFSAIENDGRVTISGPGLASIVFDEPFNPQLGQPITISMQLTSMSVDNFAGVFITDDFGTRPHHLGLLFDVSSNLIAVNADNDGVFDAGGDRAILGELLDYNGGEMAMTLTFDANGFSVAIDAGAAGTFDSGNRPWTEVPNGFDVANLGDQVNLFIQGFDLDGGAAASMVVDSVSVQGNVVVVAGDFDGDGDVDGADFVIWQTNFPKAEGGTLDTGDADADGDVDGADFVVWQTNFPFTPGSGVTPIPEPQSIALSAIGAIMLAVSACRRRNRR